MTTYRYRAMKRNGRMIIGTMNAKDEAALFHKLKADGVCLIKAKSVKDRKSYRRWKANRLAGFCRETGLLTTSGVPLVKALELLLQNEHCSRQERMVYENLLKEIRQGQMFSDAMEMMGTVFPAMLIQLLRAAEAAGTIGETLLQMADYYTKEHRMQEKWKTVSAYPKLMAGLILGACLVMFGYVLPQMEPFFRVMDELPLATRMVYDSSAWFCSHGRECLIGTGIFGCMTVILMHMEIVRLWMGKMQVSLPVIGRIWKRRYTARLAGVLYALYVSGLPVTTALQLAKDVIGNPYLEAAFETVIAKARTGERLSDSLTETKVFSGKLAGAVRIGEDSGRLEEMFLAVAEDLRCEAAMAEERLLNGLEPAIVIGMALIVGFLMLAVLLPFYESYTALEMLAYI